MAWRGTFLTMLALMALAGPATLHGQQTDAVAPALDEASVQALATLQVELNAARDHFNAAIAAVHETQRKDGLRTEFTNERAEILARHGSSELAYRQEVFAVSTDAAAQALFDRLLKEAAQAAQAAAPAR